MQLQIVLKANFNDTTVLSNLIKCPLVDFSASSMDDNDGSVKEHLDCTLAILNPVTLPGAEATSQGMVSSIYMDDIEQLLNILSVILEIYNLVM